MMQYLFSNRWVPPPLPTPKSSEQEKEAGSTYAAGKTRVCFLVCIVYPLFVMFTFPLKYFLLISAAYGIGENTD